MSGNPTPEYSECLSARAQILSHSGMKVTGGVPHNTVGVDMVRAIPSWWDVPREELNCWRCQDFILH